MRSMVVRFVLLAVLCVSSGQTSPPSSEVAPQDDAVQITHGPIVENITDTTAVIAWSTNVNAGTVLHYGTDPKHLDMKAGMPWGGLTHRVNLKDLFPGTIYYYQAESPKGQGTGSTAQAPKSSFKTKDGA